MKLEVGMQSFISKTIAESDVYLFAGITGDFNSVHINAIEAGNGRFGRRIVHGILVTGFISTVIGTKLPGEGTIYMEQNVRFVNPVFIGDTIKAIVIIDEILNLEKRIIRLKTTVENQEGMIVCDGHAIVKAPKDSK